jgi:hypothetical protein
MNRNHAYTIIAVSVYSNLLLEHGSSIHGLHRPVVRMPHDLRELINLRLGCNRGLLEYEP